MLTTIEKIVMRADVKLIRREILLFLSTRNGLPTSQRTVADALELHPITVYRHTHALANSGMIKINYSCAPHGNTYTLTEAAIDYLMSLETKQ